MWALVAALLAALAATVTVLRWGRDVGGWLRQRRRGTHLTLDRLATRRRLLSRNTSELTELRAVPSIDLGFDVVRGHMQGLPTGAKVSALQDFYARTEHGRLVVLGPPGSGKTVAALELQRQLLMSRTSGAPLPVRISASAWNHSASLQEAAVKPVAEMLRMSENAVELAFRDHELLVILDGLDEMDTDGFYAPRATATLEQLNSADGWGLAPVIVTCQTEFYEFLEHDQRLSFADEIQIQPIESTELAKYCSNLGSQRQWKPVITRLESETGDELASVLGNPLWFATAVHLCHERSLAPRDLLVLSDNGLLTAELTSRFITLQLSRMLAHRRGAPSWLCDLATYLESNFDREVFGVPLSATEIVTHQLWPIGGVERVRNVDAVLAGVMSLPGLGLIGWGLLSISPFLLIPFPLFLVVYTRRLLGTARDPWIAPVRVSFDSPVSRSGLIQLLLSGVLGLILAALTSWIIGVGVALAAWVALSLTLGFAQAHVVASDNAPISADRALRDELLISLLCAGAAFPVIAAFLSTKIPLWISILASALYCLLVGLTVASAVWRRYVALLLVTRGKLPLRLRRGLRAAHKAQLLRRAGIAYQFRHLEFQQYFAQSGGSVDSHLTSGPNR